MQPIDRKPPLSGPHSPEPAPIRQRQTRGVTLLAAGLILVLGVGFARVHRQRAEASTRLANATGQESGRAPAVSAVRVELGNSEAHLELPGATAAWYESTLFGRVNGYVDGWKSDIGDRVHAGQVLASIATPELDAEVLAAKAHLEADQAEVAVRASARDFARLTDERWRNSPAGVVAEQEREAKKADFDAATAQLAAAEARLTVDRAELSRLAALSQFKSVTAPITGVVTERRIDIGTLVTAGSTSSTTPLYRIVDDHTLRVFVEIPQNLASSVPVGTPVKLIPGDAALPAVDARVSRSATAVDPASRTLRVEIDIPNADRKLAPGLYLKVQFDLHQTALPVVPAAALMFRSTGPEVAVIGADSRVTFRPVVIARDDGKTVTLASGVGAGDVVALNLGSQVGKGDQVEARIEGDVAAAQGDHR
jgi:RND family efflux transporter MFP subunit